MTDINDILNTITPVKSLSSKKLADELKRDEETMLKNISYVFQHIDLMYYKGTIIWEVGNKDASHTNFKLMVSSLEKNGYKVDLRSTSGNMSFMTISWPVELTIDKNCNCYDAHGRPVLCFRHQEMENLKEMGSQRFS